MCMCAPGRTRHVAVVNPWLSSLYQTSALTGLSARMEKQDGEWLYGREERARWAGRLIMEREDGHA